MTELPRPRRPWDRTPLPEREYFEVLGPGLVSVLPARRPEDSSGRGWRPPTGGAWVHLGEDGRVRGFSGKVDVGQGTRAALTAVVAGELKVPASRVSMVMGDTDLCPWDMGTFGSRSMPDAAPAIAAAATSAREALVGLASRRLESSPADLDASDGAIRVRGTSRGISYAALVGGQRVLVEARPLSSWIPVTTATEVGGEDSVLAEELVSGRRVYGSDLRPPGLLYGAILHPPRYGARLTAVDASAARERPGITVVEEPEFVGVVAPTMAEARRTLERLRAEWEETPQPGELSIESYLRTHPAEGDFWDQEERAIGDVDGEMARAPVKVVQTYRTAFLAHVPLETRCAVAEWTGSRLTVHVGTQTPFRTRDAVADALGVPVEDVRVIVPPTGAGFGGKHGADIAIPAARLARAARRPVRVAYTREEEFRYGYLRPMSIVDVRGGADRDGRMLAWSFHNVNGGAAALLPPYRIAHQKVDNELSRSPLPQGSYRALAATANNFARETAVDELAREVGVDPVVFRRTNLEDERLREALDRVARRAGWTAWSTEPGRGHGIAVGLEKDSRVATVAEVGVGAGRRVRVERLVTVFDAGAVVHPASLRSQVEGAQVMGLGGALFEAIRFGGGGVRNPRLAEYRVPRVSDLPTLEVELVDRRDVPPAGGGETPIIAVAPAVGNAIFDAVGIRLRALPLAPDGVVPLS